MNMSALEVPFVISQGYSDVVAFNSGSQGTLYSASQRSSGRQVVLKRIPKSVAIKRVRLEIEAGIRLRGVQGIPHFHESFDQSDCTWLVFDRADGIDLLTFMENSDFEPTPENVVRHIATHVIRILSKVHQAGFAHKDLKLENIMYNPKTKYVWLIDFGLSYNMKKEPNCKDFAGSKEYASPEMLLSRNTFCPKKVDVWALGVTFYALLFGMFPFPHDEQSEGKMHKTKRHPRLTFPESTVSKEATDLLGRMICTDATHRMEASQLLSHAWFAAGKGRGPRGGQSQREM